MKNFAGGINPALEEDPVRRRNWSSLQEFAFEVQRALAKIIPATNDPAGANALSTTVVRVGDRTFVIENTTDPSKQAQFDVSALSPGSIRVYTFPDQSGTILLNSTRKHVFVWAANGPYRVGTDVDGARIASTNLSISTIWIWRGTAGTANSTTVDINKNGATIFSTNPKPNIPFNDTDKKTTNFTPNDASIAAGDIMTIDIDAIETGRPADLIVIVEAI